MAIRMSGMISGLDTESIVKSLMETQQAKKTKIESKKQKLEWKQEIWSGLNTKMYSFYKDYAGKLRFQSNYQTKKATSSDSTKVTVSANSSATKGTYRVNVPRFLLMRLLMIRVRRLQTRLLLPQNFLILA